MLEISVVFSGPNVRVRTRRWGWRWAALTTWNECFRYYKVPSSTSLLHHAVLQCRHIERLWPRPGPAPRVSPVSMLWCLLTSAGAGQSPSTAPNTSTAGLARVGETAEVVDALAAFQRSVADLEIGNISVNISFSRSSELEIEILLAAGTCCYSVTQTQWYHGLTVSLCQQNKK